MTVRDLLAMLGSMIQPTDALFSAGRYLRDNPRELLRAARSALGLRVGVPLDVFRWLAEKAESSGKIQNVVLRPKPPGLAFAGNLDAMNTPLRAEATLYVEKMTLDETQLRIELRIEDVDLRLTHNAETPVAMLVKSGALDLTKPGNLVRHIPNLPPLVVDAHDNRIVLDLMRHPAIEASESLRAMISVITSLLTVHGIEVENQHMDMSLRAIPKGLRHAVRRVRRNVLSPGISKARRLLP